MAFSETCSTDLFFLNILQGCRNTNPTHETGVRSKSQRLSPTILPYGSFQLVCLSLKQMQKNCLHLHLFFLTQLPVFSSWWPQMLGYMSHTWMWFHQCCGQYKTWCCHSDARSLNTCIVGSYFCYFFQKIICDCIDLDFSFLPVEAIDFNFDFYLWI